MSERNRTLDLLTPRQRRAVVALLTQPTTEAAARAAHVGRTAIYEWLRDPIFSTALEAARQEQTVEALNYLRATLLRAVQKLDRLLGSQNENVARLAAVTLLEHGLKAMEL